MVSYTEKNHRWMEEVYLSYTMVWGTKEIYSEYGKKSSLNIHQRFEEEGVAGI